MSSTSNERRVTWLVAGLLVVAAAVIGLVTWGSQDREFSGAGGAAAATNDSFIITGDATRPMRPGVQVPIDLQITNPYDVEIAVSKIAVSVTAVRTGPAAEPGECSVDDFEVGQLPDGFTISVDKNSSTMLSSVDDVRERPTIGLINRSVNQDGCKQATVELAYVASAKKAD